VPAPVPSSRSPWSSPPAHKELSAISVTVQDHVLWYRLRDNAEYLRCGRQRKADALASDIPNYGRLRMQLGLRRGRGGVVMASI
jgi:hypothetical protein